MEILNALIVVLLTSSAVGMAVSLVIQLGKLFAPNLFPDNSADNWRLGLIVLTAIVITIARTFGVVINIASIESAATALASLGDLIMPLLILLASVISKATYKNVLKRVAFIGFSHSK